MNDSNSSSTPQKPRATLKLKVALKQAKPAQAAPVPPTQNKSKLKPGASWSDEYKERMQAEMDALTKR